MPGREQQSALGVKRNMRRVVEANLARGAGGRVAEFAVADQGTDTALGNDADAVVVPIEDIGALVGAEGQVERQIELRFAQRSRIGAFACFAGPGIGFDAAVRTAVAASGRRAAGAEGQGGE